MLPVGKGFDHVAAHVYKAGHTGSRLNRAFQRAFNVAKQVLEEDHYGLEKVKDRLEQYKSFLRRLDADETDWLYEIVAWPLP